VRLVRRPRVTSSEALGRAAAEHLEVVLNRLDHVTERHAPASFKALVTDYRFADLAVEERLLSPHGIEVVAATAADAATLAREAADAHILLVQRARVPAAVIEAMAEGKGIVRYGTGMDSVDLDAARAKGLEVAGVHDYGTDQVASHALALILSAARRLPVLDRIVRDGGWDFTPSRPIFHFHEQTVGLVGAGRVGAATGTMLRGLGFEVAVYDPYLGDGAAAGFTRVGDLAELLARSDVVSLHVPLTGETRGMIGAAELASMKSHAWLVNVSRGGLVDQAALVEALSSGVIGGAALDVYAQEPPARDEPLFGLRNVVLTPHVAWYSEHSELDLRTKACAEVLRILGS
jgi:D-3-phosphoglycerate dehydrogenase / 2-oxoglutarate reductase